VPRLGSEVRIVDAARFGRALEWFVRQKKGQVHAAAALRITQPHLSKLLRAHAGQSIRPALFDRLCAVLSGRSLTNLMHAVQLPVGQAMAASHDQWLAAALEPFGLGSFWRHGTAPRGSDKALRQTREADERARHSMGMLESLYSDPDPRIPSLLLEFEETLVRRGHGYGPARQLFRVEQGRLGAEALAHFLRPRGLLAMLRVVEPLLLPRLDGSIVERTLEELRASKQLWKFVKAGITREDILLRREADLPRLQAEAALITNSAEEERSRARRRHSPRMHTPSA
jgi:hypothetical protein